MENDEFKEPGLEKKANGITDSVEDIAMIKNYEEMIKTQNRKL